MIDADYKSAEYKRLGHFLMPDCKSGRTPNGYQITTESNPCARCSILLTDFSFPSLSIFSQKSQGLLKLKLYAKLFRLNAIRLISF